MEDMKKIVVSNIRACLISVKGKVPVKQLEADYKTLIGERIPYQKLGAKSLESFLSEITSLSVTKTNNGEWFVDAIASEKSNHITQMVDKQKAGKKKVLPKYLRYQNGPKAPQTKNWKPAFISGYRQKNFNVSNRAQTVSHNQFINKGPAIKSKVVIPDHSTLKTKKDEEITHTVKENEKNRDKEMKTSTPYIRRPQITNQVNSSQPPQIDVNFSSQINSNLFDQNTSKQDLTQSSRQRITKMMADLSLGRDSGNSSPTNDFKSTDDKPVFTDNPVEDLNNIVAYYKLGAINVSFHTVVTKKRHEMTKYTCTLVVDGKTYLSYPTDFYDKLSAHQHCARLALEDILPKVAKKKSLLFSDSKDIRERIPPMLRAHVQSVWSWQIEADYADLYHEQLPIDWLQIIDSCDCVAVESLQNRHILRYCNPGEALQKHTTDSIPPWDISIPSNTIDTIENGSIYAQITCVMSLNEIWCLQWNRKDFDKFNKMIEDMETHYNEQSRPKAEKIVIGSYYVAKHENSWYRVRALEVQEDFVNCFLIDYGDEFLIGRDCLCNIDRKFAIYAAQAFVCRLAGLEDLYDAGVSMNNLGHYIGKEVILEIVQSELDYEKTIPLPVVMYDFSNGESINADLLQSLPVAIAQPKIKINTIQEVFVSHICDDGYVYVQFKSLGFSSFSSLLDYIEEEMRTQKTPSECLEIIDKAKWLQHKDRLYLIENTKTGNWLRARIIDMSPRGDMVHLYYVDRGDAFVAKTDAIAFYPLDRIGDALHLFPDQAVRVKMALDAVPENFASLAEKHMKVDETLLLKVIDMVEDVAIGEFYKRSSDEGLLCINKSIAMETEMRTREDDTALKGTKNKLVKLVQLDEQIFQKTNVPSGGCLLRPRLPRINEYFEVTVPFAVNPWNFFVQPFATQNELNQMMSELQHRYKYTAFSPLDINSILPGQIYAVKHTDGIWYRASVMKVINAGSISVFYCDFGYYANISLHQLTPLHPSFLSLSHQALKAKLSGIKPKNNKWSLRDCEYFNNLVKQKSFVSILMGIEKDELYESDQVLNLKLIDTSTDEDLWIHEDLVRKEIASVI